MQRDEKRLRKLPGFLRLVKDTVFYLGILYPIAFVIGAVSLLWEDDEEEPDLD
jgi:hypothetical protein